MKDYILNEDRFFDPDTSVRKIARELYNEIKNLPIISPHGHVDPKIFVTNEPFPDPSELFLIPDHYIFRMLYSQGIPLESLGIPDKEGSRKVVDSKKIWQLFADNYFLFAGTPSGVWLDYEFSVVFGIKEKLNSTNASIIHDEIKEKLNSPEFLPRALFDRFNIEVLSTTDAATDSLLEHRQIKESGWNARIIPCFRPDALTNLSDPNWKLHLKNLGSLTGSEITSYKGYLTAIEKRREYFKKHGAVSTDHGVLSPYTRKMHITEAEKLFQKALNGDITVDDTNLFTANMLMEMSRMSTEDGLVMQIHPGSFRNHNQVIYDKFGLDKGCDIPMRTEFTQNLQVLLNEYGNDPRLTIIVFTLDETNYSRELAPLAGHYPSMKLGPAWWFHDSIEGMARFRHQVTETAGFYNTVGFNDDTRAFVSIPARHDVARRVDSNYLAGQVAKHIISLEDARMISYQLTYGLVKKAYKL
ncbi:MAG: glucuronate isomerase [Ignavibacteriae bacterium HGW-Ignavibacteriae-2]|jgi:glucuronate isomerase|nr:MAG: glucuronate isomerase [Ignavibacteriae bacterium HGW-Ignavibacteriae-2]